MDPKPEPSWQPPEELLGASEPVFARFMQHLPGLAWIKDLAGRYVFANQAAAHAFGVPLSELYGKTDRDLFPADTAAQFRANDEEALAGLSGLQVIETLVGPDGVRHHSLVSKFPILDAAGRPVLVGGMAVDISDHLRAEERLRREEQRLRDEDRRKTEFLAVLAHELRNPLAPVRHAVEIMRQGGSAEVEWAKAVIDRQVRRMGRLIDDLLDIGRITSDRLELRMARVELAQAVHGAVEACQPLIAERAHQLTLELPGEPLVLHADFTRIEQVIANLINNAAKYTPRGGRITLTAERAGDQAVVRIRDTGMGIPAAMLGEIFGMFTQVDRSLEGSEGGLGIGLTLVRSLVELHGGTVEARSDGPGAGSEFVVRLPLSAAAVEAPADDLAERPAPRSRRVLVVDDNRDSADSLELLLQINGFDARAAYDGEAALAAAAEFRPAVVLLDIGLPKRNGYETARAIRAQPWGRDMILIALTGWSQSEVRESALEAGFDRHLVKPVDPAALLALLAQC
ncbi:MAG TPA: ATP-binding protein [Thermoanaerobaculia bacterium]|nr:ATP-binding protein [Thermoanaerobaculia bacterium]